MGFRFGGEGGNIVGDIKMPALSPTFNYTAKTDALLYQEALFKLLVRYGRVYSPDTFPSSPVTLNNLSITGSVGVAESHSSVNGTAGTFSVTDRAWRPGLTFTAGIAAPVATLPGGVVELFTQYRGTQFIGTFNIPGAVNIGSFTNEVDLGLQWRFWGPPPPP
jgi:hypothetical protein